MGMDGGGYRRAGGAGAFDAYKDAFAEHAEVSLITKPGIAEGLACDFAAYRKTGYRILFQQIAYVCPDLIKPDKTESAARRPGPEDLNTLADFASGFIKEIYGAEMPRREREQSALKMLREQECYLWQADGEVVSMAKVSFRSARHARIGHVITKPEERRRVYAQALTAALAEKLLAEGLTPVLYTERGLIWPAAYSDKQYHENSAGRYR